MKKKTSIKTLIRKIVREEVAMVIGEVITELKQPSDMMTPTTTKVEKRKPRKKIVEKKTFSSNSIINDVLNETARDDEWKTMGGGTYDSSKAGEVLASSYGNMMNDTSNPNGNLAAEMGVNPSEAPDFLTKDYSKVMKAINKKKGTING
tara:strand:- start:36 stop:482 length:447 start_codon:yes stop_codon:yes gene_type:complete